MDLALPWSPPDLETNEKLPHDRLMEIAALESTSNLQGLIRPFRAP